MYRTVVGLLVVLAFAVSPNLLFMLGVNYATSEGNPVEKFHIATIGALAFFAFIVVYRGRIRTGLLSVSEFVFCIACCVIVVGYTASSGGALSVIIVTYVTPVVFMVLLGNLSERDKVSIAKLILLLVIANAIWAAAEYIVGFRPLARIAGTTVYTGDTRAIGFLGHPLTSALLTGMTVIYLVISMLSLKVSPIRLGMVLFLVLAMVFFGGRASLALTALLVTYFLVFDGRQAFLEKRRRTSGLLRLAVVSLLVGLAISVLIAGGANDIIARHMDDEGSAATRSTSLEVLGYLTVDQWLFGLSDAQEAALSAALGQPLVIEITWVVWVLEFGLVGSFLLGAVLLVVLRNFVRRGKVYHGYNALFFLAAITGFYGLGGKTLLLCWFVCLAFAFEVLGNEHVNRLRAVERSMPTSGLRKYYA